jgi:16S rRNA (guanine966-N2)-methyltransferase
MRIVAGSFRSRRLPARVPDGTRPTSDRLRETLFNILGPRVLESVFLDAYSGTGAVGIEALSRGASWVCFVERSARALSAMRTNLASLEIAEGYRILGMDLAPALRVCAEARMRFDLVFLDPPYEREALYRRDLTLLGAGLRVRAGGWVIAEHARSLRMPESAGALRLSRSIRQGRSMLTIFESESS